MDQRKSDEIKQTLLQRGFSVHAAEYLSNKFYQEIYGYNREKYTDSERKWAYEKGFTAEHARILKLNENNYKDYISTADYFLLDPLDPLTKRLVDGKLTIHYTIGGKFPQYMPKYYCWINEYGEIIPMENNPVENFTDLKDYLQKLLDVVGAVAIKPLAGAGGIGFLKLEKKNGKTYANNIQTGDLEEVIKMINNQYVVTEFIHQCKEFDQIWPKSATTLRIIAANTAGGLKVFVPYVRFGTVVSGGACNLTSGGVGAPFDWNTGLFNGNMYRYIDYCQDGETVLDRHPDSGISLQGIQVPHFQEVKELVNNVGQYLSVHKYFGFDVIIGDDCVKLCEINSHPSLDYEQAMCGGIWAREDEVSNFFKVALTRKKDTIAKKS